MPDETLQTDFTSQNPFQPMGVHMVLHGGKNGRSVFIILNNNWLGIFGHWIYFSELLED